MFQFNCYYFKLFIVYFEDIGKQRLKNEIYKNVVFIKSHFGVESGVSRVDFKRLSLSESSRKVPTHFEH